MPLYQTFLFPLPFIITFLSSVLALLRASFCREWTMENGWHEREAKTTEHQDFPGGVVVKNPPANAGDTSLISGPGRSHMPWSN